jgi:sigma54-dependent transcription regulator
MVFDANLQEFSQKVGYVCSLENSGKITPQEAYSEIKRLYKDLKESRKALGLTEEQDASGG